MINTKEEYQKALEELAIYENKMLKLSSWEELAENGFKFLAIRKCKEVMGYPLPGCKEVVESFMEK